MEFRPHKTLRWLSPLARVTLLQGLLVSASHAAPQNNIESKDLADAKVLALLNLDSYSTGNAANQDLYLDVTLNGASAGLVHFDYRDGQLWASPNTLQTLGFIVADTAINPVRLDSLAGIKFDYDARHQAVKIVAPLSILNLSTTVLDNRSNKRTHASSSTGMLLNYNVYGSQTDNDSTSLNAYTELRAFNSIGVFNSSALSSLNRPTNNSNGSNKSSNKNWQSDTVRLDTSLDISLPDRLISIRSGDILTGALSWTRSTRLGGVQVGTNFNLQPYLATTPLPSFFGNATLPSAVELYVDGLKEYSGNVPAGPFELNVAPSISGAGKAQLVLTDALGQNTTVNFSLYDTHRLLKPKLSDWSAELGVVRENYGINSFDYGSDIAAIGTWRYGVSNSFTAETHAEVTNGLTNAGVGGTWSLGGSGGILFASLAGSEGNGGRGTQYSASYSWNNSRFNIGLSTLGASGEYRDVGTQYGYAPASSSNQISTGYSTQSLGNFSMSYNEVTFAQQDTTRFASANWSKSFGGRLSMNANYNQDISNSANSSISFGASLTLGRNINITSSVQRTDERNDLVIDASKSAPSAGGIGWRAQAHQSIGDSNNTDGLAELNYLSRYGQVMAGVRVNEDSHSTYASGTGSLVLMGGGLFAARQINSGFAVVSTNGVADVPVLLQNNRIGTTNSRGLLLVTPLNAYQDNKISIDPMGLPADLRIKQVSINATPSDRAGTLVAFGITQARAASVILKDSNNEFIEIGSQVRLMTNKGALSAVVGFDGDVYLDALDDHNTLEITTPTGAKYTVSFDYQKQGDGIPLIGPLTSQRVQ